MIEGERQKDKGKEGEKERREKNKNKEKNEIFFKKKKFPNKGMEIPRKIRVLNRWNILKINKRTTSNPCI